MASPIGHSLIGISIYYIFLNRFGPNAIKAGGIGIIGAILLANLPDGDFVFGLLIGDPDRFHGLLSHSLVFAVSVAAMLAYITRERTSFSMQFWFCFG